MPTSKQEINLFMQDVKDMIVTAESMNTKTGIRFDPFLFMLWRIWVAIRK